jgi:hypothetical protein
MKGPGSAPPGKAKARWTGMGLFFAAAALAVAQTNLSTWAFPGPSGRVLMQADALGNRIPDYSAVGYKNGTTPIPDVPVKITLSPVAGDDAATIQSAINAVKALPLDTNGFRGAILLNAGEYQIAGNITIDASGIVLRGVGDGTNGIHNTALPPITKFPAQFPLIQYATLNVFAFALGSLPGTAYLGSLSNNATAGTVDLVISPAAPPQFRASFPVRGRFHAVRHWTGRRGLSGFRHDESQAALQQLAGAGHGHLQCRCF